MRANENDEEDEEVEVDSQSTTCYAAAMVNSVKPAKFVKRRLSPGGVILCPEGHIVPRRRYNAALRFRQQPTCGECGSTDLELRGQVKMKKTAHGTPTRMMWVKRAAKLVKTGGR